MTDQRIGNLVILAAGIDSNPIYETSLIKRALHFNPFTNDGQRVIADCVILGMAGFICYSFYNEFTNPTRRRQKRVSFQCTNDCCVQTDDTNLESREIQTDSMETTKTEEYEHLD